MKELTKKYSAFWTQEFGTRLAAGRALQRLFYNRYLVNPTLKLLDKTPWITAKIIQLTHGNNII